jgi:DNA polymerase (family 10)
MTWIPPTLREDRGEIEAAAEGRLPELIQLSDIKGDLQMHTNYSDGMNRLEEMVETAKKLGYEYICISDHAQHLHVAGGLSEEELFKLVEKIHQLNEDYNDFTILTGIELNIDNEGNVDYSDDILSQLDVVIASIHGGFRQSKEQLTKRMVKAMENPHIDIIGHPTGRILGKRPPYELDLPTIFKVAAETGTYLEVNAFPDRLDLKDEYLIEAKQKYGVKFSINTDAHMAAHLRYMRYGVATAQRGWLTKEDVLNTKSAEEIKKILSH